MDSRPRALQALQDSVRAGQLVVVAGTGVSMSLTHGKIPTLSWRGLIKDGFAYALRKGKITAAQKRAWETQLGSNDLDDLLGAAEFFGRKLDAPEGDLYGRWLAGAFESLKPTSRPMVNAVRALHAAGIPICTLNYDHLLESATGLPSLLLSDTRKVAKWMRREHSAILHLHGSFDVPSSCVLGIRDYESTLGDEVRELIQRSLSSFRHLLFIGCGDTFGDPNLSALIAWLRKSMGASMPVHYALVSDRDTARRDADTMWAGFVEPLSYGVNPDSLPVFLTRHLATAVARKPARRKGPATKRAIASAKYAEVLRSYRAFLIRDCGQITIEGVRADLDMAQRRFDLERLFVPLKLLPCPPDIPANEPNREQLLQKWHDEHKESVEFGAAFAQHRRLALLALPGGGKSVLLKRLAVAYADERRLGTSEDHLPPDDITPVLIRCREWREYIRLPIPTLLRRLSEVTGQSTLANLNDALAPRLQGGRVLLLVDGLDEIHNDGDRATFVDHLETFMAENPLIRLVVTSREAGFNLVAPSIARFCARFTIAPLEHSAIESLCDHWHKLTIGDTPQAREEATKISAQIIGDASLQRLAENPLLLTMLLVVKHGAGRLPPGRVSLYERAVEVLLDTWNIKGHDALNVKEAVPQLACVAFELMCEGKQTATERELLSLLEAAREKVPQIQRYAKDTPLQFLKRVELRSSLLLEGGHKLENGRLVPFYQFRHLTFQEYLAAFAVVEGHYLEYKSADTIVTPLELFVTSSKWKEVIPMAAVLARKRAEPLIALLVRKAEEMWPKKSRIEFGARLADVIADNYPIPVNYLVESLCEEAEAAPETVAQALRLIALMSHPIAIHHQVPMLSRGPYGREFLHQVQELYWGPLAASLEYIEAVFGKVAAEQAPSAYWLSPAGRKELTRMLESESDRELVLGLMTCAGLIWGDSDRRHQPLATLFARSEDAIFRDAPAVSRASSWAFKLNHLYYGSAVPRPKPDSLDRLLILWLGEHNRFVKGNYASALRSVLGLPRDYWKPNLSRQQIEAVHQLGGDLDPNVTRTWVSDDAAAALMVGFHSRAIWTDAELDRVFSRLQENFWQSTLQRQCVLGDLKSADPTTAASSTPRPATKPRKRSQPSAAGG